MRRLSSQNHLFTLLEMVIAMAILAMLAGLLATVGNQAFESWRQITREQAHFARLLNLDRTVDNMFRNIIPFTWPDRENKQQPAFFGEPDRIRFAYRHALNSPADGTLRFAGLHVLDGQLLAVYQERPLLDWDAKTPAASSRTSVLTTEVDTIEFWYADWDTSGKTVKWKNSWGKKDDVVPRTEVPLAILLIVRWSNGDENSWLRRTAGNGQYSRFGRWIPRAEESGQ